MVRRALVSADVTRGASLLIDFAVHAPTVASYNRFGYGRMVALGLAFAPF